MKMNICKTQVMKTLARDCFYNSKGLNPSKLLLLNDQLKDLIIFSILGMKNQKKFPNKEECYYLTEDFKILLEYPQFKNKSLGRIRKKIELRCIQEDNENILEIGLLLILSQWDDISSNEYTYKILGDIIDYSDHKIFERFEFSLEEIERLYLKTDELRQNDEN